MQILKLFDQSAQDTANAARRITLQASGRFLQTSDGEKVAEMLGYGRSPSLAEALKYRIVAALNRLRSKTIDEIENLPDVYSGDAAFTMLRAALAESSHPEAAGGIFAYVWSVTEQGIGPVVVPILDPADARLETVEKIQEHFSLIIVDSGNKSGDSWKYIYHPGRNHGLLVDER